MFLPLLSSPLTLVTAFLNGPRFAKKITEETASTKWATNSLNSIDTTNTIFFFFVMDIYIYIFIFIVKCVRLMALCIFNYKFSEVVVFVVVVVGICERDTTTNSSHRIHTTPMHFVCTALMPMKPKVIWRAPKVTNNTALHITA
jgi:hypothetical protein